MSEPALSVAEALARVLAGVAPLPAETVPLAEVHGRTLAADLAALRTQPPVDLSAMDGYALRHADLAGDGGPRLVGESRAGTAHPRPLAPGEAIRIFTGAAIPEGADTILVQEDAAVSDGRLRATVAPEPGRFVRRAGLDFADGEVLLRAGTRLGPTHVALAAAMNHAALPVARRPLVAILATGDELVAPGTAAGPERIVASNAYAIAGFVAQAGGTVLDLGIVGDDLAATEAAVARAREAGADVLVTLGGASVGDHDLVKPALARQGMALDFWRIAMRPGKPLIHGRLAGEGRPMAILGLPGNPVSSIVCGVLFLVPLLRALAGDPRAGADRSEPAVAGIDLPANGARADYMRAGLTLDADGRRVAVPNRLQDSSMLRVLADSEGLLIRAPHAPAAPAGSPCRVLPLRPFG